MKRAFVEQPPNWVVQELSTVLPNPADVMRVFVRSSQGGNPVHTGWLLASTTDDVVIEKRAQPGAPVRRVTGGRARKIRAADKSARSVPDVDPQSFEFRILKVPRLYLDVLWVHSPQGKGDWVIPYASFGGELREGERYTLQFFLEAADRLAKRTPACPRV